MAASGCLQVEVIGMTVRFWEHLFHVGGEVADDLDQIYVADPCVDSWRSCGCSLRILLSFVPHPRSVAGEYNALDTPRSYPAEGLRWHTEARYVRARSREGVHLRAMSTHRRHAEAHGFSLDSLTLRLCQAQMARRPAPLPATFLQDAARYPYNG